MNPNEKVMYKNLLGNVGNALQLAIQLNPSCFLPLASASHYEEKLGKAREQSTEAVLLKHILWQRGTCPE